MKTNSSVLRQIKVLNLIKRLAEEEFSDDLTVEQYGLTLVITPRNLEELKEVIKELASRERFVIEFERERREIEEEFEPEREFEYE